MTIRDYTLNIAELAGQEDMVQLEWRNGDDLHTRYIRGVADLREFFQEAAAAANCGVRGLRVTLSEDKS